MTLHRCHLITMVTIITIRAIHVLIVQYFLFFPCYKHYSCICWHCIQMNFVRFMIHCYIHMTWWTCCPPVYKAQPTGPWVALQQATGSSCNTSFCELTLSNILQIQLVNLELCFWKLYIYIVEIYTWIKEDLNYYGVSSFLSETFISLTDLIEHARIWSVSPLRCDIFLVTPTWLRSRRRMFNQ